jgi:hypothetical protein
VPEIEGDDFLDPADAGFVEVENLHPPAAQGGIALIHAEQIGGEQGGFLAAGSGAHFQDGVASVVGVLGQQGEADFGLDFRQTILGGVEFLLRQGSHLGIVGLARQRLRLGHVVLDFFPGGDGFDQGAEFRHLARQGGHRRRIERQVGAQASGRLLVAAQDLFQLVLKCHRRHPPRR